MTPHSLEIHSGYEYFGVRFLPGMNPLVVDAHLGELIELVSPLEEMIKNPYLEEEICMAKSFEEQINIFMEQYSKEYMRYFINSHQTTLKGRFGVSSQVKMEYHQRNSHNGKTNTK